MLAKTGDLDRIWSLCNRGYWTPDIRRPTLGEFLNCFR